MSKPRPRTERRRARADRRRDLVARAHVTVAAPAVVVWRVLLDLGRYMPVDDVVADWRVGGAIHWTARLLGRLDVAVDGRVTALEPGRAVAFEWADPLLRVTHRVAVALREDGPTTRLALTEDGHGSVRELGHAEGGWRLMLNNLKAIAEGATEA